jgi:fructose-1-phosphate kinase PfkB-like protein
MAKTNYNPLSILCANEEEKEDFKTIKFQNKIIHTSKVVVHYQKDDALIFDVPPLELDPKTFVGAGDSFIAGIIQSLLGGSIDINNGIKIAQNFLTSKL